MIHEVPSPIDLRDSKDASEWASTALEKRPDRPLFFAEFAAQIQLLGGAPRILELGSGPGFLADHILRQCAVSEYVALDFSTAMHELARARLGMLSAKVKFVERSFKTDGWVEGLGAFDCVVTNEAVHELRHKSLTSVLHSQVRLLLPQGCLYLVNDHFAGHGGMSNHELYMTQNEQIEALREGGFSDIRTLRSQSGMALLSAR